jgi:hypothetical protein
MGPENASTGARAKTRAVFLDGSEVAMLRFVDVLGALAEHEDERRSVMVRFRAAGGSPDRWQRRDREAMVDALSRVEDIAEIEHHGRWARARVALRIVRRRLEDELDGPALVVAGRTARARDMGCP